MTEATKRRKRKWLIALSAAVAAATTAVATPAGGELAVVLARLALELAGDQRAEVVAEKFGS